MKTKRIGLYGWLLAIVYAPVVALGQAREQEREIIDARLEGYDTNVTLDPGGGGLMWLLFIFLGVICLAVLFKDARRTHLD